MSHADGGVTLRLGAKASALAHRGHPWFYRDDLAGGEVPHGALVRLADEAGRDLGLAFTSQASKLVLRRCGPWPEPGVPDLEPFLERRLRAAVARRAGQLGPEDGVRLVHGESDDLPGLVLDRYGPVLVAQVTTPALEPCLDALAPFLAGLTGSQALVARNDVAVRKLERLPQEVRLVAGPRLDEVVIREHGICHPVRPFAGHKTGFYLDQRPARGRVKELARGRRVLDLFSYQGAFSLCALAGGAVSALAVDQDEQALALASAAAERNGLAGLSTRRANVFELLRELREGEARFDLVVLDPPPFARSRRERSGAERGYRDLNRLALRLLAPGGLLLTGSCSHHVTLAGFEDLVRQAAAGLPFKAVLRQRLGAGDDHPVWLALPESEYLKVLLIERL
jgi:23S rRNA (cytosine1962-C5)-methyltransferase